MKKNILNRGLLLIILAAAVLSGCKVKKVAPPAPEPAAVVPAGEEEIKARLSDIAGSSLTFSTFQGKAKADLSIGNNRNEVTMNIRIRKDEAIWVSVTALAGLEVARALITPDSLKIINRMENVYIRKPFNYVHEFTNDNIGFGTLQAILMGNAIPGFITDSVSVEFLGEDARLKAEIGSMTGKILVNKDNKVMVTDLADDPAGRALMVKYTDFKAVQQQLFPHTINMSSKANNKNISLNLEFSKVDLDLPADLPFRVPDRFLIKN